jgi:uncharacterized protein (DUF2126 family)/transglutaminase-like putative cysteine protease
MSLHVALTHVTHYHYDRLVTLGPQTVRLRPAPHTRTRVLSYGLRVLPAEHFIHWQQDPQSNHLARLVFPKATQSLRIEVDLVVEMAVFNPFDYFLEPAVEQLPFAYEPALARELAPYLVQLPELQSAPKFQAYVAAHRPAAPTGTNAFLVALNQQLQRDVRYLVRLEPGVQTPEDTLRLGQGSCRDTAWLLVQLLRYLGLAARFVSGYLIQLKSDVPVAGEAGVAQDFTDLHAWCEVYLPGAGWIGLDPTSGLLAGEGHIPLACSPEPGSAAPVSGAVDACETTLEHRMEVVRLWEAPRVTLPYSGEQWAAIDALGQAVDVRLRRQDVRLTQGGEPTFVSLTDRDGEEWSTAALGPTKRGLSAQLMTRLQGEYGRGALLHCGQGKWYPGEPLPRWSLNLFWRFDGQPLWALPELLAAEDQDGGATAEQAEQFLTAVAGRLGLGADAIFPAYEDAAYFLWRERKLPVNVSPLEPRLSDPLEREQLSRVFTQGLGQVVGHVLPLARSSGPKPRWQSSPWFLRTEHCFLVPGDSPMGYRLPLNSQPWAPPHEVAQAGPPDPTQHFAELPAHGVERFSPTPTPLPSPASGRGSSMPPVPLAEEGRGEAWSEKAPTFIARTALCAEPRHGRLHVFMPPLDCLEDYVALLGAVEETALEMELALVLEGSEPPRDPRLVSLRVTPDPGVIEVNIHPAHRWSELVVQTTHLYEAATQTGLSAEKFMLDGRHIGTGGGNHVVLGGATPGDSPFLRRPDLLASMVAYWHNHPALSYLFSGLFVGPTSQAPRVDEARNDSVYELEIALAELRRISSSQAACPPWLIDRLLRNLLIDVSGNTHRTEFCIDKLYAPDSASGRLGLLELRAFEMPPHPHMALAQHVLLRALVCHFWAQPYRPARLQRWGTELHDRFMLPHFIWQDLCSVIEELNAAGFALQPEWFAPHLNFRFPKLGDFSAQGVEVELRLALEPWHVMGEEGGASGTVRYVDASLERVQVLATGWVNERHVLTCNGRKVPLQSTGRAGEYVAGVRFRAWNTAFALHPSLGVQAPLTFDCVDTAQGRSVGGCQYHVAHPGGRNHSSFPVNALEAEARRLARFFRTNHTPGPLRVPAEERNPDFPFTLDLRRARA